MINVASALWTVDHSRLVMK